jgi:hypothetical protein
LRDLLWAGKILETRQGLTAGGSSDGSWRRSKAMSQFHFALVDFCAPDYVAKIEEVEAVEGPERRDARKRAMNC